MTLVKSLGLKVKELRTKEGVVYGRSFSEAVLGSRCSIQLHNKKSTTQDPESLHYIGRASNYQNRRSGARGGRRGSNLANDFSMWRRGGIQEGLRDECIELYRDWIRNAVVVPGVKGNGEFFDYLSPETDNFNSQEFDMWRNRRAFKELLKLAMDADQGQTVRLGCWCCPDDCHGDVVVFWVRWLVEQKRSGKFNIQATLQAMHAQERAWGDKKRRASGG